MRPLAAVLSFALLSGCAVGPNYQRPVVATPPVFRGAADDSQASIGDTKWPDLFNDDTLKQLITKALEHNFDLRIAVQRVEQARAQLGITRSAQFPTLNAEATSTTRSYAAYGGALSWELDFWGRLRRLTEASRADYLATEEGRHAVTVGLIADVTEAYFTLLENDVELGLATQTRDIATNNQRLVGLRHDRGAASGLDVAQAEQLLYLATAQISASQRLIGQSENTLSLLMGEVPGAQPRGKTLEQIVLPPTVPAGLPSALLARRPDIRGAEQNLIAANAEIGAARALYFPQVTLTALLGVQSPALSQLVSNRSLASTVTPSILLPIFNAGRVRSQVRLTEARQRELLAAYERSIYSALREVSDALIAHDRSREERDSEDKLVAALSTAVRLSTTRYQGGIDSYLQVIDAQRNLFQGQLQLARLRLAEVQSIVELYRALGGGWQ